MGHDELLETLKSGALHPFADFAEVADLPRTGAGRALDKGLRGPLPPRGRFNRGQADRPRWRLDKAVRGALIDAATCLAMAVERAEARPAPLRLLGWLG